MKTFDEAARLTLLDDGNVDELWRANVRSLAPDIKASGDVRDFLDTLCDESDYSNLSARTRRKILTDLYSAFHMGVAVGIEMEKPAAPGFQEGAR